MAPHRCFPWIDPESRNSPLALFVHETPCGHPSGGSHTSSPSRPADVPEQMLLLRHPRFLARYAGQTRARHPLAQPHRIIRDSCRVHQGLSRVRGATQIPRSYDSHAVVRTCSGQTTLFRIVRSRSCKPVRGDLTPAAEDVQLVFADTSMPSQRHRIEASAPDHVHPPQDDELPLICIPAHCQSRRDPRTRGPPPLCQRQAFDHRSSSRRSLLKTKSHRR